MIKSPRGTQDLLPSMWPLWRHVLQTAERTAEQAGYRRIDTPMFEETSLFTHATGEHTDVNREMYTFEDRGGDNLSLRPEGTASVFRAYFQHGMKVQPQPVKLYYIGSVFRYERPQKGRLREHHQFGCEAIGSADALVDASMIALQDRFYRSLGISQTRIDVNSIGDENCRPEYLRELVAYFRVHDAELCSQCRERVEKNPLRVLDCKVATCQPILNNAPKLLDRLCDPCRSHWERFLAGVKRLDLPVNINTRLVRGLDYYTRTVWEFLPIELGSAQSTIGAGGRYDALAQAIGANPVPGVGFSTGLERVMLNLDPDAGPNAGQTTIDVTVASLGDAAELEALAICSALLDQGVSADMSYGGRSLGTQLKQADAVGAKLAIIIGDRELDDGVVTLRDFRTGSQSEEPIHSVSATVKRLLLEKE